MCGFLGFTQQNPELLKNLSKTIKTRAIDAEYFYDTSGFSLYHAHLKIEDTDKQTSQPYIYKNFIISFVGEIYNRDFLIEKILGKKNVYYTELEIIARLYEKLGAHFVEILNGEFAISIYDTITSELYLFRDRWGTKPLYYTLFGGNLFFSSEIKSLIFQAPNINKSAIYEYLIFRFIISPNTFLQDIFSLPPGHFLRFHRGELITKKYGEYISQNPESSKIFFRGLEEAVIRRIPRFQKQIFLSLSGGVDSGLLLGFLNQNYHGDLRAFSYKNIQNSEDIEVAERNCKKLGIPHQIIDTSAPKSVDFADIFTHESPVKVLKTEELLNLSDSEYANIRVEFGGDGKEELLFMNTQFDIKQMKERQQILEKNNIQLQNTLSTEFIDLNNNLFDFNLRIIDKMTLPFGRERRLPFTDYELLTYRNIFKNNEEYNLSAKEILKQWDIETATKKYGYKDGIHFSYIPETLLIAEIQKFINQLTIFSL